MAFHQQYQPHLVPGSGLRGDGSERGPPASMAAAPPGSASPPNQRGPVLQPVFIPRQHQLAAPSTLSGGGMQAAGSASLGHAGSADWLFLVQNAGALSRGSGGMPDGAPQHLQQQHHQQQHQHQQHHGLLVATSTATTTTLGSGSNLLSPDECSAGCSPSPGAGRQQQVLGAMAANQMLLMRHTQQPGMGGGGCMGAMQPVACGAALCAGAGGGAMLDAGYGSQLSADGVSNSLAVLSNSSLGPVLTAAMYGGDAGVQTLYSSEDAAAAARTQSAAQSLLSQQAAMAAAAAGGSSAASLSNNLASSLSLSALAGRGVEEHLSGSLFGGMPGGGGGVSALSPKPMSASLYIKVCVCVFSWGGGGEG
jgi:hypothetical protein